MREIILLNTYFLECSGFFFFSQHLNLIAFYGLDRSFIETSATWKNKKFRVFLQVLSLPTLITSKATPLASHNPSTSNSDNEVENACKWRIL